jgi:tol-pal system protein YbgF
MESIMRLGGCVVVLCLSLPLICSGQSKEFVAIQQVVRDVANLEDLVKQNNKAINEKLDELSRQIGASSEAAARTGSSLAGLESGLKSQLEEQQKSSAVTGAKVTKMEESFQNLSEMVATQNARLEKLEQLMADIKTALTTIQSPAAPPAPEGSGAFSGLSADKLFENAMRDKNGGETALALKEFTEYVQSYSATYLAPQAQYYIGEIYYNGDDLEKAVQAFDAVLERFPTNEKTPDAHYMKGMALAKLGRRAEANKEFTIVVKEYSGTPLAARAKAQISAAASSRTPAKSKSK